MGARAPRSRTAAILVGLFVAAPTLGGGTASARTREPAFAGTWYPEGRARLASAAYFLMRLGAKAPPVPSRPIALVVPHAGWNFSGLAAATAYRQLRPGDFDRVVVVGPSHTGAFAGYSLDDAAAYRTSLGAVPLCPGALEALEGDLARVVPGVAEREYAIEAELPFLQTALGRFCLVPILVGETDPPAQRAFAERLAGLDDGRTLFVFSADFAHYGPRFDFTPFGALSPATLDWIRDLDRRAVSLLERVDAEGFRSYLEETRATICGRHGLAVLLELLPRIAPRARPTLLAHYLSADLPAAQDDASVSYVAMAFGRAASAADGAVGNGTPPAPEAPLTTLPSLETADARTPPVSGETGARLVRLARATLRTALEGGDDVERELAAWPEGGEHERRQGVFVSLYRTDPDEIRAHGRLRGCIGQAEPAFPPYYGTVQAAIDAALHDARFEPVKASELARLEVEVTLLSPRQPVASWRDVRIGTHGIVLEKGDHRALVLPQVAAAQGSVEEALSALAFKAGLPADGWRDGARLSVFTGQVFGDGGAQASR